MKHVVACCLFAITQLTGQLNWNGEAKPFMPCIFAVNQNSVIYMGGALPESGPDYLALYKSYDDGLTWTEIDLQNIGCSGSINGLAFVQNKIFICGPIFGLNRLLSSSDDGKTWQGVNTGIGEWELGKLVTTNSGAIFLTAVMPQNLNYASRLYKSDDQGSTWIQQDLSQINPKNEMFGIDFVHGKLLFSIYSDSVQQLYSSTDDGTKWTNLNSVFPASYVVNNVTGGPLQDMYANCDNNNTPRIARSMDGGKTWQETTGTNGLQSGMYPLSLIYHQGTFLWGGADYMNDSGRLLRTTIPHIETSLEEISAAKLKIWPVPASDILYLEDPSFEKCSQLMVTDIYGKCVLVEEILIHVPKQLKISHLDPGV